MHGRLIKKTFSRPLEQLLVNAIDVSHRFQQQKIAQRSLLLRNAFMYKIPQKMPNCHFTSVHLLF